jgi:hypothetical protein
MLVVSKGTGLDTAIVFGHRAIFTLKSMAVTD